MKLNKNIIIFIVGAGILLGVFLLLPSPKTVSQSTGTKTPTLNIEQTRRQLLELMNAKDRTQEQINYKTYAERNPFVVSQEGYGTREAGFKLKGIFWGGVKPCVIINNTVLSSGDKINGATVKEITNEFVILIDASGKQMKLSIKFDVPEELPEEIPQETKAVPTDKVNIQKKDTNPDENQEVNEPVKPKRPLLKGKPQRKVLPKKSPDEETG